MDQDKQIKLYLFGGFVALIIGIVALGVHSLISNIEHRNDHGEAAPAGTEATVATAAEPAPSKPAGELLMEKNDCVTCHRIDTKLIGPAYKEVAAKYADADEATVDHLVKKVKEGGQGVWGQVPMTPHPQVSDKDIRTIVEWVLTLK